MFRATKKEIRQFITPYVMKGEMKSLFRQSMLLLLVAKSASLISPFCLKAAVNALAVASQVDFTTACVSIGAFGALRLISSVSTEVRMNKITEIIQSSTKKISTRAFDHLHALDLYFHRVSAKNTVFAVHRAIKSIDSGLRFTLGFFVPVIFEFSMLCGMLYFYCGPLYLGNMLVTLTFYTVFSKEYSKYRQKIIR